MKKLLSPIPSLARWVAGLPPRNPPGRMKRWFFRILTTSFVGLIGWFLFLGPGVVPLPFAPRGFHSTAGTTNSAYYQEDGAAAREILRLAREAQDGILEFWGATDGFAFFKGTKLYLAEATEAYYRLTMNRAGGFAMLGSIIVINMSKAGPVLSIEDFPRHELGHNLRRRPRLLSLTSLRYHTDWETLVAMAGSTLARQHYGYVGAFVEYLERRFGIEPVRDYLRALSWGKSTDAVFAQVYGSPLATIEGQFVADYRVTKGIAFRQLCRSPGFTAVAVLALALGISSGDSGHAQVPESMIGLLGAKPGAETTIAGMRLCWCPPGRFTMGSPRTEPERRPGEDQVEVTLTKGFWMAKYEATQEHWKRCMGKLPGPFTAELPEGDRFPVGNVNFAEAESFCQRLTALARQSGELPPGWAFRLPTEAQWEYACRAGTTTATGFGDRLSSKQANFQGKPCNGAAPGPSLNRAAEVGSYPANAWGLHDMHGNVFEWCRDWYHRKLPGGSDPDLYAAMESATRSEHGGVSRVRRGGCWSDDGWSCRSAFRLRFEPERRYDHIGFRVVLLKP